MQIYIKHLSKEVLLYKLWEAARNSPNLYYCTDMHPILTVELAKIDINHMIGNARKIDITTYYGRMLFIDISDDYVDIDNYEMYNGQNSAKKIIKKLKEAELQKTICNYYKFF